MMTYLLILLAIGLVLSPLLAMAPSPRQRQQQRLRARAMQRGLQVQFCDSDPGVSATRAISYRLPLGPEQTLGTLFAAPLVLQRDEDAAGTGWSARQVHDLDLDAVLMSLPADVFRLTLASRRLAADWRERGDTDSVDAIANALEALRDRLLAVRDGRISDADA